MHQCDKYRKFLLNRMTSNQEVVEYIENSLITEDEMAKHSFHKVLVCRWPNGDVNLFETLYEYFGLTFVPINFVENNLVTSFYTNSLMLMLKVLKLDFMFPYHNNMFSMDILLNDKTSMECFDEKITIDEIITQVVSHRFNEDRELNFTNFCDDPALKDKKIHFYKLNLLSHFKLLMIKMGRDTRTLNLSSNNLQTVPLDILNFFIKGDLICVNLSNNLIPSLAELQRISSKIEKLWLEGNPLCEDFLDPVTYIRQLSQKFPRLTELDGVHLSHNGIMMPFYETFISTPDEKTKMFVERFVPMYFALYDTKRKNLKNFYDNYSTLTITTDCPDANTDPYVRYSRNLLNPIKRERVANSNRYLYGGWHVISIVIHQLPETVHDLNTFKIDVVQSDVKSVILVVDGVLKEKLQDSQERYLKFRRTFVIRHFIPQPNRNMASCYAIVSEMLTVTLASDDLIKSFKSPIRNMNQITLIDPDPEDRQTMCNMFTHFTNLKKNEAELRLKQYDWDISKALKQFVSDFKRDNISSEKFLDEDDFSDVSSLLDEID